MSGKLVEPLPSGGALAFRAPVEQASFVSAATLFGSESAAR